MATKKQKRVILEALIEVKKELKERGELEEGICWSWRHSLKNSFGKACQCESAYSWHWPTDTRLKWQKLETAYEKTKKRLFKSWPKFSGDVLYPVPGKKNEDPSDAFDDSTSAQLWTGGYGKRRRQLLNYMIKTLKEELE